MSRSRRDPPRAYGFNDADRVQHEHKSWRPSAPFVAGGGWADLWRSDSTVRGGGTVSSVLPVLALHTWPGKDQPFGADPTGQWTGWAYLSVRRIARLAGVHLGTVARVFDRLEALNLLQRQDAPDWHQAAGGTPRRLYRLSHRLYPGPKDRFGMLPGTLFYGGAWSMLPTASARHLLVAVAALDPIHDEEAFLAAVETDGQDPDERLAAVRARNPLTLRRLVDATGLQRSTVEEALRVLRAPLFDTPRRLPLVTSGPAADGPSQWLAIHQPALAWYFRPEILNDPARRRAIQKNVWPFLAARWVSEAKRRSVATRRGRSARQRNTEKKARSAGLKAVRDYLNGATQPDRCGEHRDRCGEPAVEPGRPMRLDEPHPMRLDEPRPMRLDVYQLPLRVPAKSLNSAVFALLQNRLNQPPGPM